MIYLECNNCKSKVGEFLTKGVEQHSVAERDLVLPGEYFIKRNQVYVNIHQACHLRSHHDSYRYIGCCGPGPEGLPNLVCDNCQFELARECTDCIFPLFIRFEVGAVNICEVPNKYVNRLKQIETHADGIDTINELLTVLKYNPEDFDEWLALVNYA